MTKSKSKDRIAGDQRTALATWVVKNSIRIWGLGVPIEEAAELAAKELRFDEVNPATLGRTMRYLLKIKAIRHKIGRKRQVKGPTKLGVAGWAKMDVIIRHLHPWLCVERWTLPAVQRRLASEKANGSREAVIQALKLRGFIVEPTSSIERVVFKGNR